MPSRRTFLQGAAVGLAPLVAPGEALAGLDRGAGRIHAQLQALRGRESVIRQEYLDSVYDDRPAAADREITPHIHALASGLAALSTVKDIEQMPIEDQVHPGVQHAIRGAAAAVGQAMVRCRELLEVFLTDESPERETHLRAGLRGVRMSVRDWPTTSGRQHTLQQSLADVEAETESGALLRRARRSVTRIRKAERLAAELDKRGETAFEIRDRAVLGQIEVGRARWADEPDALRDTDLEYPEDQGGGMTRGTAITLGILVLAVGCAFGGILALSGACIAACGAPEGILLLLAGMAIIGLSIWGGITLIQKGRKVPRQAALDEGGPATPRVVLAEVHVPVLGVDGWVDTGVERAGETVLVVRGTGLVRLHTRWAADADGNGETGGVGAFVPAAPLGALVGRVGEDVFFLGSEGVVPSGAPGRLQLAVNQAPPAQAPKGHFAARVTQFG
ncbi:MAG: hypothetical protein Q8P18_13060 [Pseudomonadota bacterium]|nr:hypothetical protein [Pseudomonadota bacterium]